MTEQAQPLKPTDTRLVLVSADGAYIHEPGGRLMGVVLTEVPNANATDPISLDIEQQCSMGHWHRVGRTQLPTYDGAWPADLPA